MHHIYTKRTFRLVLRLALVAILLPMLAALSTWTPAAADDHREAPLIMLDPVADVSDTYAFIRQPGATASPLGVLAMIPEDIDPATWGDTSMLLELGDDIPDPLTGPFTTSVQITQLGLRSAIPIIVTNPDGTTEQWDVEIGPSPTVPSTGTLSLIPTVSGGGSFTIEIPLTMNVTYTRQGDGEVRTVDYATQPGGAVPLIGSGSFSLNCPTNRLMIPDVTTPFCIGHDVSADEVFPVLLADQANPINPRFSTRVEPTLAPVNNPPVLNSIGNMTMNEGGRLGRTLGASDPDGNGLVFSVNGLPDFVTFIDRGDGTAIFDSMPAVGDAGVYTITVTVTDDGAPPLSDSETFTLTVVQGNRPPVLDPIAELEVVEGEILSQVVSASDPDGNTLVFTASLPTFATLINNGDGTATLLANPAAGDGGTYMIVVTVTDDGAPALNDEQAFTLIVRPAVSAGGPYTVAAGLSVTLTASSSNPLVSYAWDLDNDGDFDDATGITAAFDASALPPGDYTVTVEASVNGARNTASATVTVVQGNRPPVLDLIADRTIVEGETLSFVFGATDPDGDGLTFTFGGLPDFCSLTDLGDNLVRVDCAPGADAAGEYTVTFTVTDDGTSALSDSQTVTFTVVPSNQPPVLDAITDITLDEGGVQTTLLKSTDPDGDTLTFSATGLPGFVTFTDNGDGTAFLDLVPLNGEAGAFTVTVTVIDDGTPALADSQTFTITVRPFLNTGGDQTVAQGGQVQLNPTSSPGAVVELDLDNDGVFESPAPAIFDATGLATGDFLVGVRAFLNDVFNTGSITVTVLPRNNPPVLDPIGELGVDEGTVLEKIVTASDPDSDVLLFSLTSDLPFTTFCELIDNGNGTALLRCSTIGLTNPGVGRYRFTVIVTSPLLLVEHTNTPLGDPVELTATSPNPSVIYFWDFDNDGDFDDASGPIVIFPTVGLTPGAYPVKVQGCVELPDDDPVCNTADTTVRVVGPDVLILEPREAMTSVGGSQVFYAFVGPGDADGNPDVGDDGLPGTADDDFEPANVFWETDAAIGMLDMLSGPSTTFTATQPGSGQVRATDADGRTASADITVLRRAWTYDDLRRLTLEYVDNPFVARGLALLVDLAAAAESRGFGQVADGILDAYIRGIQAITPRLLTPEERDELVDGAQALQQQ